MQLVRGPSLLLCVQGFQRAQAGQEVNPEPKPPPGMLKRLSRKEKQKWAEQQDAAYLMEQHAKEVAHYKVVEHSWGESRLDKTVKPHPMPFAAKRPALPAPLIVLADACTVGRSTVGCYSSASGAAVPPGRRSYSKRQQRR